jgi:hypothetical protein
MSRRAIGRVMWKHFHILNSSAASEAMGAVEYGENEALRERRTHFPWGLVLFLSLVGVAVVHITGMVAGVRWVAWPWPRPARLRRWAGPGRGCP